MAVLRTEFLARAGLLSESDKNRLTVSKNLQRVVSAFEKSSLHPQARRKPAGDTSCLRMRAKPQVVSAIAHCSERVSDHTAGYSRTQTE